MVKYWVIKHLLLPKIRRVMDIKRGIASIVYKYFDKKSSGDAVKNMSNQDLA